MTTAEIKLRHDWVRYYKGKPSKYMCLSCKTNPAKDWSNVGHKYRKLLDDYIPLCRKCHIHLDWTEKRTQDLCKRLHTKENALKTSQTLKGRKPTAFNRKMVRISTCSPVIRTDNNGNDKWFESIILAAEDSDLHVQTVSHFLRGMVKRNYKGYVFRYAIEKSDI